MCVCVCVCVCVWGGGVMVGEVVVGWVWGGYGDGGVSSGVGIKTGRNIQEIENVRKLCEMN